MQIYPVLFKPVCVIWWYQYVRKVPVKFHLTSFLRYKMQLFQVQYCWAQVHVPLADNLVHLDLEINIILLFQEYYKVDARYDNEWDEDAEDYRKIEIKYLWTFLLEQKVFGACYPRGGANWGGRPYWRSTRRHVIVHLVFCCRFSLRSHVEIIAWYFISLLRMDLAI